MVRFWTKNYSVTIFKREAKAYKNNNYLNPQVTEAAMGAVMKRRKPVRNSSGKE